MYLCTPKEIIKRNITSNVSSKAAGSKPHELCSFRLSKNSNSPHSKTDFERIKITIDGVRIIEPRSLKNSEARLLPLQSAILMLSE